MTESTLERYAPPPGAEQRRLEQTERKTRGLIALAATGGDAKAASRYLRRTGSPVRVQPHTLERWRDEMPDVYARVAEDYGGQLEQELVVNHRETALKCMDILDEALDHTRGNMKHLTAAESSRVALDLSRIVSMSTKDMLLLTGRPTAISDDRGAVEIIGALAARFPKLFENLTGGEETVEATVEDAGPEDLMELPPPPQEPAPDVEEAF